MHEELYYHMRKRGVQFDVKTEYDTPDILVGASMKIEVRLHFFLLKEKSNPFWLVPR